MRIAIAGSSGRMGRTLIECVLGDVALKLSAALEQSGHALLGRDAGDFAGVKTGINISADLDALAAYVSSLTANGDSPDRAADGSLTSAARAGQGGLVDELATARRDGRAALIEGFAP